MTTAAPSDDSVDGAADEKLPETPTRRWATTDATQQRILDAATDVGKPARRDGAGLW